MNGSSHAQYDRSLRASEGQTLHNDCKSMLEATKMTYVCRCRDTGYTMTIALALQGSGPGAITAVAALRSILAQ